MIKLVKHKRVFFIFVMLNFTLLLTYTYQSLAYPTYNIGSDSTSCTIFTISIGDKVYFGNNEDFMLKGTYIWFIPPQEVEGIEPYSGASKTYGSVFFGFDNNDFDGDGYPEGGMNEKGLCYDGNGLPLISMNPHPEREDTHSVIHIFFQILWECSTCEEVIEFMESHYLGEALSCQIHFADATGDAMVISVGLDGELTYTRRGDSNFLISTNFNLANPENGYYPCDRYDTSTSMLTNIKSEEELTIESCRNVLDAVSNYKTSYSNIFDIKNKDIYIYQNHDFDQYVKLNLDEELEKVYEGAFGVQKCGFVKGALNTNFESSTYSVLLKQLKISELFATPIIQFVFLTTMIIIISLIAITSVIGFYYIYKRKRKY